MKCKALEESYKEFYTDEMPKREETTWQIYNTIKGSGGDIPMPEKQFETASGIP